MFTTTPGVTCTANVTIKVTTGLVGNGLDILIAPITRCRQNTDTLSRYFEPINQLADTTDSRGVVAIIKNHPEWMFIKHIHTTGSLEYCGTEGTQSMADVIQ